MQSRDWASVSRGKDLWPLVEDVLRKTFDIDAGMFVYHKQFLPDENQRNATLYNPWGFQLTAEELTDVLRDDDWFTQATYVCSERWNPVSDVPANWRTLWTSAGISYAGSWPLIVKKAYVGAIVLGRKTPPEENDEEMMSACSTYVSLVLEMLTMRRMAEYASRHDPLTGILNRTGFLGEFNAMVQPLSRAVSEPVYIGILDVNRFKEINDSRGHLAGDSMLRDIADVLKNNVKHAGICGRFGGDEFVFAIRLSAVSADDVAVRVASWFDHEEYTVSVGCAQLGTDGRDWDACLGIADQRLYDWKANVKRNR